MSIRTTSPFLSGIVRSVLPGTEYIGYCEPSGRAAPDATTPKFDGLSLAMCYAERAMKVSANIGIPCTSWYP